MDSNNLPYQRLYWALSKPLKYMGLTIDEWAVVLVGVVPGIILLNSAHLRLGAVFIVVGVMLCYSFKKYKRISQHFKLKSWLVAKGLIRAPLSHPNLLYKRVGK
ncbi:MAG: hypothetical protein EOP33_05210 [Rickettsiaceae bacterium]|nr:MAG: hypothetical protein EOP33_05210 [Rickettsiaceae bacterium]